MPITRRDCPEQKVVIVAHVGPVSDAEFIAFYQQFFHSDHFDPSQNLLVDLREADSSPRSSRMLRRLAKLVFESYRDLTTRTKVAVVAPRDLSFGLARMYAAFSDAVPWDFTVFRAIDAARAWLGLPDDLPANGGDKRSREGNR